LIEKEDKISSITNNKEQKRFTIHDITRMAIFIALWFTSSFVWVLGGDNFIVEWIYGILTTMILIIAALIIGKRFTIILMGTIYTAINLFFWLFVYGPLTAIMFITGTATLEFTLLFSKPYGASYKIDIGGGALYGFILQSTYYLILVFINGMYFPMWYLSISILNFILSGAAGGYLGYRLGNKIKPVVESI